MFGNPNASNNDKNDSEKLGPGEFRQMILKPAFRDAYNDIIQAHRVFLLPQYYFEKWRPLFGTVAHAVYEELRRKIYYNPQTGERRERVNLKQTQLAQSIGIKDPKTIRKALRLLEEYGFIDRERTYYKDPVTKRPHQGTDRYIVYFEIPLVDKDMVELLVKETEQGVVESYEGKSSLHKVTPPPRHSYEGKSYPPTGRETLPDNISTLDNTVSVTNVTASKGNTRRGTFANDPRIRSLTDTQREDNDDFVDRVIDTLNRYANPRGDFEGGKHQSRGFIRRAVYLMPRRFINEALMATKDMLDDQMAGKRSLRKSPSAYFAGIVRHIAAKERIDLGIKWKAKKRTQGL